MRRVNCTALALIKCVVCIKRRDSARFRNSSPASLPGWFYFSSFYNISPNVVVVDNMSFFNNAKEVTVNGGAFIAVTPLPTATAIGENGFQYE